MTRADPITQAEEVVLVDDDFNTEDQRRAAELIQEHWAPGVTLQEIADQGGYTRQHIKKTLDRYFESADKPTYAKGYREGFRDGYAAGHADGVEDARQSGGERDGDDVDWRAPEDIN